MLGPSRGPQPCPASARPLRPHICGHIAGVQLGARDHRPAQALGVHGGFLGVRHPDPARAARSSRRHCAAAALHECVLTPVPRSAQIHSAQIRSVCTAAARGGYQRTMPCPAITRGFCVSPSRVGWLAASRSERQHGRQEQRWPCARGLASQCANTRTPRSLRGRVCAPGASLAPSRLGRCVARRRVLTGAGHATGSSPRPRARYGHSQYCRPGIDRNSGPRSDHNNGGPPACEAL